MTSESVPTPQKERQKSAREEIRAIDIPRDTFMLRLKEGGAHRINRFKVWAQTMPARSFSSIHAGSVERLSLAQTQNEETISEKEKKISELELKIADSGTPDTWIKTTAVGKSWQQAKTFL